MKRIIYNVPRWSIYHHRSNRRLPLVEDDDPRDLRFEDELFERLYCDRTIDLKSDRDHGAAEWAEKRHGLCDDLGLKDLKQYCRDNPFNAALAAAWIVELIEEQAEGGGGEDADEGVAAVAIDPEISDEDETAVEGLENVDM